jgi:hypothetical protein
VTDIPPQAHTGIGGEGLVVDFELDLELDFELDIFMFGEEDDEGLG